MNKRIQKILGVIIILVLVLSVSIHAKSQKRDEKRFQLGFGAIVSTGNLLGIIESVKMSQAIQSGNDYDYPGISKEESEALNNLDGAMQRAILVANILGSMEYGFQFRLLWNILMVEADLFVLPFDGSYNGRVDMLLQVMAGVRAPFWIMPYIIGGANFTFSFYPGQFTTLENWKGRWAATDNFAFRPGFNLRTGLDFKFKGFSIGAYYQYTVKDVQEYTLWYDAIVNAGIAPNKAVGMIFGAQSRFGVSLCWYIF